MAPGAQESLGVRKELQGSAEVLQHLEGSHHIELFALADQLFHGGHPERERGKLAANFYR
jgi:hypothetical protein